MKILVGSGFHESPHIHFTPFDWLKNIRKVTDAPIVIIADSGHKCPIEGQPGVQVISLTGDCGHMGSLLNGDKKHRFPGGPAVLMALAALAYIDEASLVYAEQDMLMFGDCIGRMQQEIGDGGIIFGKSNVINSECSLFLLKHWYIPRFLETYAGSPAEHTIDQINEVKMARWAQTNSKRWKYHTMRGGRDRPLPYEDKEWYFQKATIEELATLREKGLL